MLSCFFGVWRALCIIKVEQVPQASVIET